MRCSSKRRTSIADWLARMLWPSPAGRSQLLEQRAGLVARVLGRALQIGKALFQNRRFLRVGLANLSDDFLKCRGFTAHGRAAGVVVQDHFGPLQAALRLNLDRRGPFAAAARR